MKEFLEKMKEMLVSENKEELDKLEPIYVSYFIEWNSFANYELAKRKGFHDLTHEWRRTHHIEDFDQIDSRAYLVHSWMKYPKFGHAHATDHASRFVREGIWTRDYAIEKVKLAEPNPDINLASTPAYTNISIIIIS